MTQAKHLKRTFALQNFAAGLNIIAIVFGLIISPETTSKVEVEAIDEISSQEISIVESSSQEVSSFDYPETEDSFNQQVEREIALQMEQEKLLEQNEFSASIDEENSMETSEGSYAEADYELLSMITFAESGNQTFEQQVAVAATLLNRVRSDAFPNTLQEVICQKGQFSSVKGGKIYAFGKILSFSAVPEISRKAAKAALQGEDPTEQLLREEAYKKGLNSSYSEGGALYFYNPKYTSSGELAKRESIKCKVSFGDHIFYKVW